jgi:hypothetical protein
MGYSDYLKSLLRSLRLYDLDAGIGAAELDVLGTACDAVYGALEAALTEAIVPTASGAGLAGYEAVLPYAPAYITPEDRRAAVMALLRIDGRSFTKAALCDTLSGCGIAAVAEETETAETVAVRFPQNRGIPAGYDAIRDRIERILPCHLAAAYEITYITWAEIVCWFSSWAELETACASWDALERYQEEA